MSNILKTRLRYLLINSDISALCFVQGLSMILWGLMGIFLYKEDLKIFDTSFHEILSPNFPLLLWGLNAITCGLVEIVLVIKMFPKLPSLTFGAYLLIMWSWVAAVKPVASLTSSVVMNAVVITVGLLILHRSSRQL